MPEVHVLEQHSAYCSYWLELVDTQLWDKMLVVSVYMFKTTILHD
jgi:hypothetical protein